MPPNERKPGRKEQTKLMFDPVVKQESLSPTKKSSPAPARVRYRLPASAKSKGGSTGSKILDLDNEYYDDDDPVFSQSRPRSSPYKVPSDDEGFDDEDFLTPPKTKKPTVKVPGASRSLSDKNKKQKRITFSDSYDDEGEDELAIVTPTTRRTRWRVQDSDNRDLQTSTSKRKKTVLPVDDEDESPITMSTRRRPKPTIAFSDDEDEEDKSAVPMSTRRHSRPTITLSDDEDEEDKAPPRLRPQRPTINTGNGIANLHKQCIELSDDEIPILSPSKRRRHHALTDNYGNRESPDISPPKRIRVDDDGSDVDISPTKRSRRAAPKEVKEGESDSDIPSRCRNPRPSSSKSPATPSRYTRQAKPANRHRTAKQKAAELLRRKRAGEKIDAVTDSSSSDESTCTCSRGLFDVGTNTGLQALDHFEDEEPDHETTREAGDSARRRADNDGQADDEDEGFIVHDDDNNALGIPEIPLQFTRRAHKPLKENFADCIEWLVHNLIDADFPDREDQRYRHAFNKVDDEAQGYAASAFISPQWTAEFTASIKNRPHLNKRDAREGEGITAEGVPKCDACNHRNHPPKYVLTFEGLPYNRNTLEDVEQDSDYDSDDEDASPVDEKGNELEPEGREWFSGRDCSDKAFQAHRLTHWKYSFKQSVIDNLETGGHLEDSKVAEREVWSADEKWIFADEIVQSWKTKGAMNSLFLEFKRMMDNARSFEPSRYNRR